MVLVTNIVLAMALCIYFCIRKSAPARHRVLVNSDIWGTDPDDLRAMLQMEYADK